MANREKGDFEVSADGRTYLMRFNTNAMVEMQTLLSPPGDVTKWQDIVAKLNGESFLHIRAFVWACLRKHHPDITVEGAGDLLDAMGGFAGFDRVLMAQLGETATPDPADLKALEVDKKNPRTAQGMRETSRRTRRGTGRASTATRAASV